MWNKRPSYFLIVRVRRKSLNIVLPLPLFVIEDLLRAAADLVSLWESVFPQRKIAGLVMTQILSAWLELRRFGSWRFADIADGENQISISFY